MTVLGDTPEELNNKIEIGVQNGYSVEAQLEITKLFIRNSM